MSIFTCMLFSCCSTDLVYLQAPESMDGPSLPHGCLLCMSAARCRLLKPALLSCALPPVAFQTLTQAVGLCLRRFYSSNCCGRVTPMVGDMSLIMQQVPSDAVSNAWFNQLGRISQYRTQPTFDLARCLAQDQNAVNLSVS